MPFPVLDPLVFPREDSLLLDPSPPWSIPSSILSISIQFLILCVSISSWILCSDQSLIPLSSFSSRAPPASSFLLRPLHHPPPPALLSPPIRVRSFTASRPSDWPAIRSCMGAANTENRRPQTDQSEGASLGDLGAIRRRDLIGCSEWLSGSQRKSGKAKDGKPRRKMKR